MKIHLLAAVACALAVPSAFAGGAEVEGFGLEVDVQLYKYAKETYRLNDETYFKNKGDFGTGQGDWMRDIGNMALNGLLHSGTVRESYRPWAHSRLEAWDEACAQKQVAEFAAWVSPETEKGRAAASWLRDNGVNRISVVVFDTSKVTHEAAKAKAMGVDTPNLFNNVRNWGGKMFLNPVANKKECRVVDRAAFDRWKAGGKIDARVDAE